VDIRIPTRRAHMRKYRVILVSDIIAPYRLPLFEKLSQSPLIDLQVYFLSESTKERRWKTGLTCKFNYKVFPRIEFSFRVPDLFTYLVNPTLPLRLIRENYDVVITDGWFNFACQAAFFVSKMMGKSYIIWSRSTMYEQSLLRWTSLPLVNLMVRHSDACITPGKRAKEYLVYLGADEKKIFTATNTVDVDHFRRVSRLSTEDKREIKQSLGIKTRRVILYVGRLIEKKGVGYLIEAYSLLRREYDDVSLLILGYGYKRGELKKLCQSQNIPDVCFANHVETDEMPKFYGIADLFVLPSRRDIWGLVLNEAMACGLPVITTKKVGASVDLVRQGVNGWVVPEENPAALYGAIRRIVTSSSLRQKMGQESSRIIRRFSIDNAANGFLSAIEYAMSGNEEGHRSDPQPL